MRLLRGVLWVFAVFSIAGCAEVTTPVDTAAVSITVNSWPVSVRLNGVEVCETDNAANCETTDGQGQAALWLPVGETSFTREREGYGSYLIPVVNPQTGHRHQSSMASEAVLESLHEDVVSQYPHPDTGRITLNVGFAGATFDLFDADGEVMAKRFFYDAGGTSWRDDVSATITGEGGFLEVEPGEYQIEIGGTADDCTPIVGWPGRFTPNSIRFPVQAGYITQIGASCSEK